jgi:pimeloyl-ACP methyl ester carboxylesterase
MVLFFHGNAANITHRLPNIDYLHQLGLNVFIFDYRGFGKSNGVSLREEDLYQDARGALKWLKGSEWDSSKVIYYGRSMGATVALQMALEQPPAGIILECPFTSLHDIAMKTNPISYGLVGRWFIKDRFDNINKISSISAPVLIFHGKKDRIIPFGMSVKLFSFAKEPKTLHLVNEAGHNNCYLTGGEEYKKLWISFVGKYSNYNYPDKLTKNLKERHSKGRMEFY